jgi:hypothetical protein
MVLTMMAPLETTMNFMKHNCRSKGMVGAEEVYHLEGEQLLLEVV